MRFFALLDFQHLVLGLFIGLLALLFAAAGWMGYERREEAPEPGEPPDVPEAGHHPVGPFLALVYAGAVVGALGYALFQGILGGPVGY